MTSPDHRRNDNLYSRDELLSMISAMRRLSDAFYGNAVRIGNHAFIEFAGLMNEYIKMCVDTVEAGGDFTQCNVHTGQSLSIRPHQAEYLAEKFECIFGPTFRSNPEIAKVFALAALGITVPESDQCW